MPYPGLSFWGHLESQGAGKKVEGDGHQEQIFKDNCKVPVKKKCYTGQVGEISVGHKQEINE